MAIRADVPGMGAMYFPEGMSEDEIYARIDQEKSRLAAAREIATGGMPSLGARSRTASADMSPTQREILDTIAGTEAPDYNTLYGGRKVADLSRHPGIDVPIQSGPNVGKTSSAFGRYQFIEPTWNEEAQRLGLKDMSPASQDAAAWDLASRTYKQNTGGDLEADWASGDPAAKRAALGALSKVWTSLPGGVEQAKRYGSRAATQDPYKALSEYRFDPRELPTGDILTGALHRGMEGLKGTMFDLVPALGASIIGKDEYAREQLGEFQKRMESAEEEFPTAFKSYKDIEGIGHAFDYGVEAIGENGADIVAFMLGAGAGSAVFKRGAIKAFEGQVEKHLAKDKFKDLTLEQKDELKERLTDRLLEGATGKVAKDKAADLGSTVGAGLVSEAINAPETFQQVYEDTGELRPDIAMGMGTLSAALDTIVPKQIFNSLTGAQKEAFKAALINQSEVVPQSFKRLFFAETGKLLAEEGATEATQQVINNLASDFAGANKDLMEGVIDSFLKGAIGGAAYGAPGAALEAGRRKQAIAEEVGRRETLGGEPGEPGEPGAPPTQYQAPYGGPGGAPTTPAQGDLFGYPYITEGGMGRADETVADVSPTPERSSVIDEDVLSRMGLPTSPRSWAYKNLFGRDLSTEEGRADVGKALESIQANSKISKDKKQEISDIIRSLTPMPSKQAELPGEFAPQFESTYGEKSPYGYHQAGKRAKAAADFFKLRAATPNLGVGPQLPSGPGAGVSTGGTGVSPAGRVEVDTSDVSGPAGRTPEQQRALEAEYIATRQKIGQLRTMAERTAKAGNLKGAQELSDLADAYEQRNAQHAAAVAPKAIAEKAQAQKYVDAEHGYSPDVDIQNADDHTAVGQLKENKKATGIARAARTYLSKLPMLQNNLANIAYDLASPAERFRAEPERATLERLAASEKVPAEMRTWAKKELGKLGKGKEAAPGEFYQGMGTKQAEQAARWVQQNLSPEANEELDRLIKLYQERQAKTEEMDKQRWDTDQRTRRTAYGMEVEAPLTEGRTSGNLELYDIAHEAQAKSAPVQIIDVMDGGTPGASNELSKLAKPLATNVISALRKGDLRRALLVHAENVGGIAGRIAKLLASKIGKTKVNVSLGLSNYAGRPVNGYYDPKTNTIHLDATEGLNSHVFLHESAHAVFSHVLDDPNNPLTRHLTQLFEKVKGSLDSAYGAKDVHEFASEAWGNEDFANTLRSINPEGNPHSAWDRFVRAISNFFRKMLGMEPKSLASAYDQADALLSAIASPAPESRNASVFYAPNQGPKYTVRTVDKIIDSIPFFNDTQKSALSQAINFGSNTTSSGLLSLMPIHALNDLAEQYFPGMARRVGDLLNQREGLQKELNKKIDPIIHLAKQAIKVAGYQQQRFDDLVHESTIKMVDPTRDRSYYKDNAEKLAIYDDLRRRYTALKSPWQNLYVKMRDAYKAMYEEIVKSVNDRIDGTEIGQETKDKIKANVLQMLTTKNLIDPYFALGRQGNHWLAAPTVDANGQPDFTVEAFKSTLARQKRIEELVAAGTNPEDINTYANAGEVDFRRAPAGSFINSVFHLMKNNGVSDQAIEQMMNLFISTLPETAWAKSMQARKEGGRAGYDKDSVGVFERKMRNMAHQVANLRFNPKIGNVVGEMGEATTAYGKLQGDNQTHVRYLNEYKKRLPYILNPTKHDVGSLLTSTAFMYTLGFNVSSALVNLANIPMIVAPYLMGKYSGSSISGALGSATKTFLNSGFESYVEVLGANGEKIKMKAMPSLANYDPNSPEGRKYATLLEVGMRNGQFDRSQFYEMLRGDTSTGKIAKINAASGWAFHHGERMNREITMMATYDLELQRLQKEVRAGRMTQEEAETQAANEAIYTTELTNGSLSAAGAPRIAQNSLGKVLFMYKRYAASMYYMLFKTGKHAFNELMGKEDGKAAMKQLGGIYGMAALMAGVQGVPLFGLASMVYSLFRDDDDDDLGTVTRKYLSDFVYKGPLEYMTNLSIAGRISLSDLIVRDTKQGTEAGSFSQQIAQSMGGPVLGIADRLQRGFSKIREGHFERGMEDILPAFAGNILKAGRYATEGTQTLRGDPITGDVSAWNIGAQALGFAPADYTNQLEKNDRMKGMHDRVVKNASNLKRKYYVASRMGDREEMRDIKDQLLELGAKHKGLEINRATISGVLSKSMKAHKKATEEMRHGVRYSKRMLGEIKEYEREWDQ